MADPQSDMGGYQPWQAGMTGSLMAHDPSWRDRLASMLIGDSKPLPEQSRFVEGLTGSRGFGITQPGVLDATPAGLAFAGNEAYRDPTPDNVMAALPFMPGAKGARAAETAGIRAYHGSPHDFDKFDMSKIGTGEGAQAYGHGLYFAEQPDVARSYKTAGTMYDGSGTRMAVDWVDKALTATNNDPAAAKAWLASQRESAGIFEGLAIDGAIGSFDDLASKARGKMYEVRINADPEHFLDWDKPLSQQSEKVKGAVAEAGRISNSAMIPKAISRDMTVSDWMSDYASGQARAAVTPILRDAGIPGIKYLDQGSRTAGEGSRNYVVFDDGLIDILRKYGIAGTMVAGGGMAVSSSDVEAHPALIPLLMGTIGLPMYDALTNMPRDADRAELMLNRQSPRLYDYAPKQGVVDPSALAQALQR